MSLANKNVRIYVHHAKYSKIVINRSISNVTFIALGKEQTQRIPHKQNVRCIIS